MPVADPFTMRMSNFDPFPPPGRTTPVAAPCSNDPKTNRTNILPTKHVNLHVLRKACSKPVDDRTVREDRYIRDALQLLESGRMTHVVLAYLGCPTRRKRVQDVPVYNDETVSNAQRIPLTPQQLAFVSHVLPRYLENDELRGFSEIVMAVHGMLWDDVELVGENITEYTENGEAIQVS